MARKTKITQTRPMFGNRRSHSMRASRRLFNPNLQSKQIYVPETDEFIRVRVTARELKTIDKIGLVEFLSRQGLTLNAVR